MARESNTVYSDLVGFLKSDRADLRLVASEAAMGVTDGEGMSNLITNGAIPPLCRLSSISHETSGTNALAALVHLSSSGTGSAQQGVEDILDCKGVGRTTEICLSNAANWKKEGGGYAGDGGGSGGCVGMEWRKRVNYAMALLVNVTRVERGAIELSGFRMPVEAVSSSAAGKVEEEELGLAGGDGGDEKTKEVGDGAISLLPSKPTLALLTSRFLSNVYCIVSADKGSSATTTDAAATSAEEMESKHDDPYQNFASVLMNATQVEQGRQFVMKLHHPPKQSPNNNNTKPTSILQSILPQLRHPNPLRRRGIAGTIKNCCFERDNSWYLLHELNIIPHLLYPLAGPEELDVDDKSGLDPDLWLEGPDKVRETDRVTRLLLVEALLLLCASGRRGREELRLQRVYVVLKFADMVEECEEVNERIQECVQFLRRDEEGTSEGSSDFFVEEAYSGSGGGKKKLLALPAPSAAGEIRSSLQEEEEYDDVD